MEEIRNIIFDFGGVIINIDPERLVKALVQKGIDNVLEIHQYLVEKDVYNNLETGKITADQFRDAIRSQIKISQSDEEIDADWNSIILDIPESRVKLIEKLADHYNLYLLSNTNIIHYNFYNRYFSETYGYENLASLFKKAYFSHEMGVRKPDPEIYRIVLRDSKLVAEETMFIDDNKENIIAANEMGIKGFHLDGHMEIKDLFRDGRLCVKF
jgi:putative hydrolase of the HAD superfamily